MAAERLGLVNRVRDHRLRLGWSQEDLARRSGLSRAGISAIETERLIPSASSALALAAALGCKVEEVFALPRPAPEGASWAWEPRQWPCRYWQAEVGGGARLYPVEATPLGVVPHDGVAREPGVVPQDRGGDDPKTTLVMACCDPAVGLLASALAAAAGIRLIALPRSSRSALGLLGRGAVHVAGVHLGRDDNGHGDSNIAAVRETLGTGYVLLRAARWEEGVAFEPARRLG